VTGPLISAAELLERRGEITLLDVRYRMGGPPGREDYLAGHIPGAAYVDMETDLAAPPGAGGRHPLPDATAFGIAMRRCGVFASRPVVVYDDWSGHAAGRLWWLLRHHGHPDVRVLDGGWAAWGRAGGGTETGDRAVPAGDFEPLPGVLPVVDVDGVLEVPVLIDARAPERYRGDVEPVDPVAGRIPGAVNVPSSENLRADGTFKPVAELREMYAAVGASDLDDGQVAVYCGSGVTAVHDLIALELLGVRGALYPGSWSGWITDPDRPRASG
jgi:thiosulfate/3-mercaptopyruvate sulfurtransferase